MLLAFDDNGPGPVVVLLHGFPLNRKMWVEQVSHLGDVWRVITPDLRGHGETAAPEGTYTMDEMADDVIELLDALGVREPVVLGGLSMGGYVALSAALRYPGRFRALMLMDTRAGADSPEAATNREQAARQVEEAGNTEAVVKGMLPKLFAPTAAVRAPNVIEFIHNEMVTVPPRAVAGALRGMAVRPDRTADLPRLTMPALVLVGEQDAITPAGEARAMADALPNATFVSIPDAGHLAPLENTVAANRSIRAFLDGLK